MSDTKVSPGRFRVPALLLTILTAAPFLPVPARDCHAASCPSTGRAETAPADVHAAVMEARAAAGAYEFSSGAMDAARECADLVNRVSRIRLGSIQVPGVGDVLDALEEAAGAALKDSMEEACRYVASTGTSWIRSQVSAARIEADRTASELAGAPVSVSRPDAAAVMRTYRARLRGSLPAYSDIPSLGRGR